MHGSSMNLLESCSDAVLLLRVLDGTVVGTNRAASTLTGRAAADLTGRSTAGLLVWLAPGNPPGAALGPFGKGEAVAELPIAVRSRSTGLQVARLSGLPLDIRGRQHALCVIRDARTATLLERRLAVRAELPRIVAQRPLPQAGPQVLAAIGECLGWDTAALWELDPPTETLRCTSFWSAPSARVTALEAASRQARVRDGAGPLGRAWQSAGPTWTDDLGDDAQRASAATAAGIGGRLLWPIVGAGGTVGMLELLRRDTRPADPALLELASELGHWLGGMPGHDRVPAEPWPPALLQELAIGVGRLNRLLERVGDLGSQASDAVAGGTTGGEPLAAPLERQEVNMTLKGVSERTGIPAATVRTWERRYGFIHPARTASGYRVYREDDIDRILMVKRLLEQGVRIGQAAVAASREAS
jgi:hypothetical protein